MTLESALRRLSKICRENIAAFEPWETTCKINADGRPSRRESGEKGEARGTVATSRKILTEIQRIRNTFHRGGRAK